MALVGGGGAPNVAGANPAGIGTSINYIGNHAYAYSGATAVASSEKTNLNFTTGALYVVGRITCNGSSASVPTDSGDITNFEVKFDNQTVIMLKVDSHTEDMPATAYNEILIPPFTTVKVTSQSNGDSASRFTSVLITGEVYA